MKGAMKMEEEKVTGKKKFKIYICLQSVYSLTNTWIFLNIKNTFEVLRICSYPKQRYISMHEFKYF